MENKIDIRKFVSSAKSNLLSKLQENYFAHCINEKIFGVLKTRPNRYFIDKIEVTRNQWHEQITIEINK